MILDDIGLITMYVDLRAQALQNVTAQRAKPPTRLSLCMITAKFMRFGDEILSVAMSSSLPNPVSPDLGIMTPRVRTMAQP